MGRRILNRKELRADAEAAERRKPEDEEEDAEEEGDEDDEDEDEDEEKGEDDEEAPVGDAVDDEDDEEVAILPKKKKKAAKAVKAPKAAKPKSRSRSAKVVRMRLVWGVFNNSHQCVATYDYPKRKDAEAHAAKLMGDKKSTHFVQPVKEPIEEKKEEGEVVKTRGK